ncbi:hypothetical protein JCM3774_001045 [Rhodotorula dairenensis]
MASLLERTLGAVRKENTGGQGAGNRRVSGGAGTRASPYARPEGGNWKHDRFGETDGESAGGRAAVNTANPHGQQGPSPKLVITNLHYEVSERELEVRLSPIFARKASSAHSHFFDRSGRSEGVAWVTYASEKHAAAAKDAFDGAIAKGEPIKVDFDYRIDRPSERGTPAAGSLLARVGGPVDGGSSRGPRFASQAGGGGGGGRGTGPRHSAGGGGRAERGVGSTSGAPRAGGGGGRDSRDGGARGTGGGRGGRAGGRGAKVQPKSGGDLDAELEAFMKAPSGGGSSSSSTAQAASQPAPTAATDATSGGDVEMA